MKDIDKIAIKQARVIPTKCESCRKSTTLHSVKMTDYSSPETKESIWWWCMDCYRRHSSRHGIPFTYSE